MTLRQFITLLSVCLCLSTATRAQQDDIEANFKKVTPQEEQQLRAVLAEPIPQNATQDALDNFFVNQQAAAIRLGDPVLREQVLRRAIQAMPSEAKFKNNLAQVLFKRGAYDEGNLLQQQAVTAADPSIAPFYAANVALNQYRQGLHDQARAIVEANLRALDAQAVSANGRRWGWQIARARDRNYRTLSLLESAKGNWGNAIAAAQKSEEQARRALAMDRSANAPADRRRLMLSDLAMATQRKLHSYVEAGRYTDAENTLADYIKLSKDNELPAGVISEIHRSAGHLRYAQREFVRAETHYKKANESLAAMGYSDFDRRRELNDVARALAAQKRWQDALKIYDGIGQSIDAKAKTKNPNYFSFDRAWVYLNSGLYAQSVQLLDNAVDNRSDRFDAESGQVTLAKGLLGAALWLSNVPANQDRGWTLLESSVQTLMSPSQADFLEHRGNTPEVIAFIVETHLKAAASKGAQQALMAIGEADWLRAGTVQESLADAALRSAANQPALADLVRQDQDAKNEIKGLRRFLAGDGSAAAQANLPDVVAKMRTRIAQLEAGRATLAKQIKAGFADYDRLVRPSPPTVQDVVAKLRPDEALVMLMPMTDSVYVWAVQAAGPSQFAKVDWPARDVANAVKKMRSTLDFAEMGGRVKAFDRLVAWDLYRRLLSPVQSTLAGKRHLVVSAGGVLGQVPFGALLTQDGAQADAAAPWLIKQSAITQVPSVSGWLALRQMTASAAAPESLAAWGDPQFNTAAGTAVAAATRQVVLTRASGSAQDEGGATAVLRYADIPPLPETRDELLAIAAALKANPQADLHLGAQATKASVLDMNRSGALTKKRVLVFATHGLMAGDLPNLYQPALAMATTGTASQQPLDALLTLDEVLGLKLNADWVVLSACNTAAAEGKTEEALSGLARGFFYAGAKSLMVTHWAVETESAKKLTTQTFTHYTQNPALSKADSLRLAMLDVMAQPHTAHPAYWAPYALVGDGSR